MHSASNKLLTSFHPVHFVLKTILNQLCFLSFHLALQESLFSLFLVEMPITSSCTLFKFIPLNLHSNAMLQNTQQRSGSPKSKEHELKKILGNTKTSRVCLSLL